MRHTICIAVFACMSLAVAQRGPLNSQQLERQAAVKASYTKHEFLIPMRDGVKLFTAVYTPKDTSEAYPMMMSRTPYSVAPYGIDNYRTSLGPSSERFMKEKFIFVYQDVRGRNHSEGTFVHVRPVIQNKTGPKDVDESTDTYDTIEWLVKNVPNNNGRAGMWGISYPGFYAAMGAIDSHPALKATLPQAPVNDWYVGDDFRHNGVLFLAHAFNFLGSFGRPRNDQAVMAGSKFAMETPDGYDFHLSTGTLANYDEKYFKGQVEFWKDLISNDTYSAYWQARAANRGLKNVKPAMLTVGGWFDAEDVYGPLSIYSSAEKNSPGATNMLVEGPWSHGGWARPDGSSLGNVNFASNTAKYFQDEIEFPFFNYHLKGKGDGNKLPEAYMFETGRNEWHKLEAWPPKEAKPRTLYFQPQGKLATAAPAGTAAFDEYISDPMSRAVHPLHHQPDGLQLHDRRPAVRLVAARRTRLSDGSSRIRSPACRPAKGVAVCFDDRNRFGLGRETRRCLPGRRTRQQPQPRRRPHGQLPDAGARRAVPRQVPQRFRQAGSVHAGQGGKGRIRVT